MSVLISWQTSTNTKWQVFKGGCVHAHLYICICHSVILCVFVREIVAVGACICTWQRVCVCVCVCACLDLCCFVIGDGHFFLQLFLLFGFVCLYFGGLFCFVTFFFFFQGGGGVGEQ